MPTSTTFITSDGMRIVVEEHSDIEDGIHSHHFEVTFSMPGMPACLVHGTHEGLAGIELEAEFSANPTWP